MWFGLFSFRHDNEKRFLILQLRASEELKKGSKVVVWLKGGVKSSLPALGEAKKIENVK
ncbi:YobA family protein [Bacillus timonensis]|nr:YobA family protein [Bacillus timonensis]